MKPEGTVPDLKIKNYIFQIKEHPRLQFTK